MAVNKTALHVLNGVRLLDQEYPDWKDQIDLSLLDMNSSTSGLLEQLYDSQAEGIHALGLTLNEGSDYGFDIRYDKTDDENVRQWQELTETWKAIIIGMNGMAISPQEMDTNTAHLDQNIQNLSPSAGRLLLAFLTTDLGESQDAMIMRAGIKTRQTYEQAENELASYGYLKRAQHGFLVNLGRFMGKELARKQ